MPKDLLRRRPDVRQAELTAAAQSAGIGVAKSNLYPSFSLSGSFGYVGTSAGESTACSAGTTGPPPPAPRSYCRSSTTDAS